ncbi:MAG TPA: hypothetical protein EYN58_05170 [Candidatus Poseidoniales archaeon]|nr:hypothetical protein [Candidatus Poseidoniales archaeon]
MGLDSPEMAELVVDAVKVRTQKLQQICPTLNEIRLLAHGRQVNPMDKEQCGSDEDGWFAVSVCNRVPSKPFTKYHACLVSLEGRLRDEFIPLVTPTLNSRGDEPTGTVKDIKKIDIKKMYKKSKGKIIGPKKKAKINPKIKKQKKKKKGWFKFSPRKILNMMNFLMADAKSGQSPQNYVAEERDMTIQAADSADAEMARIDDMTIQASERVNAEMVRIDDMTVGLADPIGGTTNLVLLHHWSFKTGAGGDYESRMKSLQLRIVDPGDSDWEVGELVEKIELLDFNYTCTWTDGEVFCRNKHPYNNGTPPPTNCASTVCSNAPMPAPAHAEPMLLGNAMVPDMTANSYLVTDMVHSDGGTTESLYRGPLIAVPENHQPKGIPYGNSDQALEAMTNIDMDNISHASAFEIGRLLALTDESFMKTAARWRRSLYLGGLMGQNYSLLAEKALAFNLDTNMMRFGAPSSMSLQLPSMMSLKAAGQSISKYIPSKNPPIQVKVPTAGPDPIPNETRINMARQQAEQISTNFETGTYGLTGETSGLKGGYGNLNSEYSEQSGGGPD